MKQKETKFRFPDGIPAFEDRKEFTLIEREDMLPLVVFKSGDLHFICVTFKAWSIDYEPELHHYDLKILGVDSRQDLELYNILTIGHIDIEDTTANLNGPIALNPKTHMGKQVILVNRFPIRYKIWKDMKDELPKLMTTVHDVIGASV